MSTEVKEFFQELGPVREGKEIEGKTGNFPVREKEEKVKKKKGKIISIEVEENGRLVVGMKGDWNAKEIRAIQIAVIKRYKREKYLKTKETTDGN